VVERIDEWKRGCAIERSSVIQRCSDAHRCLVDIGDAKIDFSHDDSIRTIAGDERAFSWLKCFSGLPTPDIRLCVNKHTQLAEPFRDAVRMAAAFEMRIADGFDMSWLGAEDCRGCREPGLTESSYTRGKIVQKAVKYQDGYICS
jgi:hypothetical protein